LADDAVLNFIPGNYGDNWWGWWADFFWPALNLLQTSPIIPTRGNHEICTRGGYGYFFFMSPQPLCPGCSDDLESLCLQSAPPYAVTFENEQFLVMDDALIEPLGGGIDHFDFIEGQCPDPPTNGERLVATQEAKPPGSDTNVVEETYAEYMFSIEQLSQARDTNFYVGHRP
jgi:hypothetical protein